MNASNASNAVSAAGPVSAPVLELADVTLTYPDGDRCLTALDAVSLSVPAGELLALTGPSGSGKSSLLAVAGTLAAPDRGRVAVEGVDVAALGDAGRSRVRRERIGHVDLATPERPDAGDGTHERALSGARRATQ